MILRGDGDPPDVYYMEPVPRASALPSLASALLLAYILTEREVREGSWIKRPTGFLKSWRDRPAALNRLRQTAAWSLATTVADAEVARVALYFVGSSSVSGPTSTL